MPCIALAGAASGASSLSTRAAGRDRATGHPLSDQRRMVHPRSSPRTAGAEAGAMSFQGWTEEALKFYEGLEVDNSKAYWTAHKQTYTDAVLGPMIELTEELAGQYGEAKIFRPN